MGKFRLSFPSPYPGHPVVRPAGHIVHPVARALRLNLLATLATTATAPPATTFCDPGWRFSSWRFPLCFPPSGLFWFSRFAFGFRGVIAPPGTGVCSPCSTRPLFFLPLPCSKDSEEPGGTDAPGCVLEFSGLCAYLLPLFGRLRPGRANQVPLRRRVHSRISGLCAYPYPVRKTRLAKTQAPPKPALRSQVFWPLPFLPCSLFKRRHRSYRRSSRRDRSTRLILKRLALYVCPCPFRKAKRRVKPGRLR